MELQPRIVVPPSTEALIARLTDAEPVAALAPTVCAWCPGFDGHAESNRGVSHGICASCRLKLEAEASLAVL